MITVQQAAERLLAHERIRIFTHQSPDGDTLGCAGALCLALRALGKQAQFFCADPIPDKYDYMLSGIAPQQFEHDFTVAVDVADGKLLGKLNPLAPEVDLCIDHHGSNVGWARETLLDAKAGAACEVIAQLLSTLGVQIDKPIADCLYTGICTDTGCFRYSNTTPHTLRLAAELMECGASASDINLRMFEIKSRSRMHIERAAIKTLQYAYNAQMAIMVITREMIAESGATEGDLEGLAPIPRNIEGVRMGITLRQRPVGDYKISVRTDETVDAAAFCRVFGGGGHARAAGCRLCTDAEDIIAQLKCAAADFLDAVPEGSENR